MSLLSRPVAGTDALVLRTWPCGETSAVASLLTRDEGFVKVLAKAARRPRSRLRALVEPGRLVHAEFSLDPTRELQYLRGGEVQLDTLGPGATLERTAYLLGALELVDRCRPAGGHKDLAGELFRVCEEFLGVLSSPTCRDPALLFFGLEWRLLTGHGTAPQVAGCVCCGNTVEDAAADPLRFDPAEGGVVCARCATGGAAPAGRPLGREALDVLRGLAATDLAGLGATDLAPARRREVGALLHRFLGYHLPGYQLPAALDLLRAGRSGD
jgi:DNA repair protein RecO (recombination protein O)